MDLFAKRLRELARQLELSDAEVARRAGLSERRYGNYVRGAREPDFATFLRICAVLNVTPNEVLLGVPSRQSTHDRWLTRLISAGQQLAASDLKLAVRLIEVLVQDRRA
ncbi:helix-turn-helix transcriptional regulator [Bradyrhizobium jicamae]|uniref:Helix-turn-helix transcriptional regulator n=1 Tax=Bradyrhizobium jicamae TaxID=280332 RepID=A0ABS5FKF4_9BRAD|nr:helix-turn-helix transcriptional regulator [Bradyrhizobium jicamae]MBR0796861.1 helix-turn-helix transcriptional regulator [Bradyrhizobium jicamae]